MKVFWLVNMLLLAFAYLGQFELWGSASGGFGEAFVLGYVVFLIHFLFLLTFSIYIDSATRSTKGRKLESHVIFWIVAPYVSLTWRFKYSLGPIVVHDWQLILAVIFLIIWWTKGRDVIAAFRRFTIRSMGRGADMDSGRGAFKQLSCMRVITLIMVALPVPFWHVRSIFPSSP